MDLQPFACSFFSNSLAIFSNTHPKSTTTTTMKYGFTHLSVHYSTTFFSLTYLILPSLSFILLFPQITVPAQSGVLTISNRSSKRFRWSSKQIDNMKLSPFSSLQLATYSFIQQTYWTLTMCKTQSFCAQGNHSTKCAWEGDKAQHDNGIL